MASQFRIQLHLPQSIAYQAKYYIAKRVTGGTHNLSEAALLQNMEDPVMSKVFGMHTIALKPGVKAEDFEKFITQEVYPLLSQPGMETSLLKGDRGDRENKYLWMIEFDSVESRTRYFPSPGESSEEAEQMMASPEFGEIIKKWDSFATPIDVIYTDYVEVGK
jgi:hypothetical protein